MGGGGGGGGSLRPGARCSVRLWCDGSSDRSFMVDPLICFSFQPVVHDWYVLSCLWDGAYKITLAANRKD